MRPNADIMPTLNWIGKEKVISHHLDVPFRVLERKYTFGDTPDSGNMIIHGDNLEALKALLPLYENRIKCIYIDPPYNTGNEGWVYNDNVNDPHIRKWLGRVVGSEMDDLTRHDKWLCMMYPRLVLLQKLLSEDGAIFISIDDNEQANLKLICDEAFGERNFVDQFIWYINDGHTDNQDEITVIHEYILCYAKDKKKLVANHIVDPSVGITSKILNTFAENSITKNGAKNPPSIITLKKGFPCEIDCLEKTKYQFVDELMQAAKETGYITRKITKRFNVSYPVRLDDMLVQNGQLIKDCRVFSGWMNNAKLQKFIDNDFIPIEDNGSQLRFYLSKNGVIYYRRDGRQTHYIQTVLEGMGTTETNKYMLEYMGVTFEFPKPVSLVEYLLSIFSEQDSIILDSFAGSGTTAHAVLNLNQDGGHRKLILCEMMDYAEDITAERVRRVMTGYGEGNNAVDGTGGSFDFYELGETIFDSATGLLNENVDIEQIRRYVWYSETNSAYTEPDKDAHPYFLGTYKYNNYYFYYIQGEETCLDRKFINTFTQKDKAEMYIIYADRCVLAEEDMAELNIRFKKIPRDIKRV